ncbi:MAG: hypothetical protein AB1467_06910 [Candidatus Diapherotrites archaeon]
MELKKRIDEARKNCVKCLTYKRMGRFDPYRETVLKALNELYDGYAIEYAQLRRAKGSDKTFDPALEKAKERRDYLLDAIKSCDGCPKEIDLVNRIMKEFK